MIASLETTDTARLILDDLNAISEVLPGLNRGDLASIGARLTELVTQAREVYRTSGRPEAPVALVPISYTCPDCGRRFVGSELGKPGTRASKVCGLCNRPQAPAPVSAPVASPAPSQGFELMDGTYTVMLPNDDYRTLKIQTQEPDAKFMPGRRIASFLNGPDNWSNYKSFAFINDGNTFHIWQKYAQSRELALALAILCSGKEAMIDGFQCYGRESQKCGVCGRKLTTPESLDRGIGPECAERLGL